MNDPTQEIMYLQQKADFNKIKKLGAILWQECKFFMILGILLFSSKCLVKVD
jgi:hypothetical protein